ncbi:MAG: PD40 domain-containing protein [Myxococcales bacterium]|nr:PD40 domain-containing protein [Myxococcales bacterium]MCB9707526.1 PD40 domain-containing protein [Myxococcales bacterium]
MKIHALWAPLLILLTLAVGWWAVPAIGQKDEPTLPSRGVVIEIDSPERALYRIAVPNLQGSLVGATAAEVLRNDFKLVSLFTVLDARSFLDSQSNTLDLRVSDWSVVGAQAVIKGKLTQAGSAVKVELRLYELAQGSLPTLKKTYRGSAGNLRTIMHRFANEVLRELTGEAGAFDSRLTFSRRKGPGRKDVYVSDFDGHGVGRVSRGKGVSMLPNFGPGGIWYSVLTKFGMFITRSGANDRAIIKSQGMNMGVTSCGDRMVFSSTRTGNAEIFSANPDGSDVRQITHHRGIDVSPACGPTGQLAFVSNRHGSPQIFTMNGDGSGVKRITYRGDYNQTPAWCPDPKKSLLAFTGRSGDYDIFTVNVQTGAYTRLTQGQGSNKDPAFSPDCRMVAFASSRGGIYLSNPEGLNHNLVVKGAAETIRWSR